MSGLFSSGPWHPGRGRHLLSRSLFLLLQGHLSPGRAPPSRPLWPPHLTKPPGTPGHRHRNLGYTSQSRAAVQPVFPGCGSGPDGSLEQDKCRGAKRVTVTRKGGCGRGIRGEQRQRPIHGDSRDSRRERGDGLGSQPGEQRVRPGHICGGRLPPPEEGTDGSSGWVDGKGAGKACCWQGGGRGAGLAPARGPGTRRGGTSVSAWTGWGRLHLLEAWLPLCATFKRAHEDPGSGLRPQAARTASAPPPARSPSSHFTKRQKLLPALESAKVALGSSIYKAAH